MRWLVTGGSGMLGREAVQILVSRAEHVLAPARSELDVTEPQACVDAAAAVDVVLNCAGWTAVDAAEDHEADAFATNAVGAANLARAAQVSGARMVHISTDYVFDGEASQPYDELSPVAPRSAYGRTKAAGEWAVRAEADDHLVVRTGWLYGQHGECFPKAIARRADRGAQLRVVDDQWGQPTWTADVVDVLLQLVERAPAGTYHATAEGSTTWWSFARQVVSACGHDPETVVPVGSADYASRVRRPSYSVLGHAALRRADVSPIGPWEQRWQLAADRVLA